MAKKFSALPVASSVPDDATVPVVIGGVTKRATAAQVRAGAGGSAGKTIKAMADAPGNAITDAEGRKGLVQTSGALTDKRKLTFAAPAAAANSYSCPVLNTCTGASIVVSVGTGNEIEIEPGAKALVQITASGVTILVDLPLDPRDFDCPWDGVNDDLPGLDAMIASIPTDRQRPTVVQLPKGQGYCSDHWHVNKCVHVRGHGHAQVSALLPHNGIRFAPLKGAIFDGPFTSSTYPASSSDKSRLEDVALISTQCVVTDAGGNIGAANFFLDTSADVWSALPATVVLGTVVLRSGATVGSIANYLNDGATRDTTHVVMFRCTTPGTRGSGEPAAFSTAGLSELGDEIAATAGTAKWTVESIPKDYANATAYVAGQRVIVPGEPDHVFECLEAGTSHGWVTAVAAGSNTDVLPQATINVADASDFPDVGTIRITTSLGPQDVVYTGKTGTTFTGCTGGTGTLATSQVVGSPLNYAAWGVGVRVPRAMMGPSYLGIFHDQFTEIGAASDGATLAALPSTIHVDSTDDFPFSGSFKVRINGSYKTIAYTGKTATTFTGCTTSDTGTLATGQEAGAGAKWQHIPSQLVTLLANAVTIQSCALLGATGVASWIQSNGDYDVTQGTYTTGGSVGCRIHDTIVQWSAAGTALNSFNADSGSHERNFFDFLGAGRTNVDGAAYLNLGTDKWGNGGGLVKDRCLGLNTFLSLHGAASGGVPYRNDLFLLGSGSSSSFIHCFEECALPSLILAGAIVVSMLGGLSSDSTATDLNGIACKNIRTDVKTAADPTKVVHCTVGGSTGSASACSPFRLRFDVDSYAVGYGISDDLIAFPTKWFTFGQAESAGFFTSQLFAFPRPDPAGAKWPSGEDLTNLMPFWVLQDDMWIGQGASGDPRSVGFGTAPPVAGWYKQGAVRYNTAAAAGQPVGWQCVADGTPGTWLPMANLAAFSLATLPFTLWLEPDFSASPWVGTASAGTSGANDATEGTNPPSTGAALNGHVPASFDGTNDELTLDGTAADYYAAAEYSGYALINPSALVGSFGAGSKHLNDMLLGTATNAYWCLTLENNGSATIIHNDGGAIPVTLPAASVAVATDVLLQWRYDGTNVHFWVNSGTPVVVAAGSLADLSQALKFGTAVSAGGGYRLSGLVRTSGLFDTDIGDTAMAAIKADINTAFGLSL